jgi:hypothetical protein
MGSWELLRTSNTKKEGAPTMLFGKNEIKDYNWEEGMQYRLPADSRSELKLDE